MWLQQVKHQIVKDYHKLVMNLHVGKKYDYSKILDMINFTEIGEETNNPNMIANYFSK